MKTVLTHVPVATVATGTHTPYSEDLPPIVYLALGVALLELGRTFMERGFILARRELLPPGGRSDTGPIDDPSDPSGDSRC